MLTENLSVTLMNVSLVNTLGEFGSFSFDWSENLVSSLHLNVISYLVDVWVCLVICLIGVVTNIIIICVFANMGFDDTINITLTTISFSDLIRVAVGAFSRLYGPISLFSPSSGKTWQNVTITTLSGFHAISSNVSFVLGAYVALERCLCVSLPFTVRTIMTKNRTVLICLILPAVVFGSLSPRLHILEYIWVFSIEYNTTIAIYQTTDFFNR